MQEELLQDFRAALVHARSRQSIEGQIDTILKAKCENLEGKSSFIQVIHIVMFAILVSDILFFD